MVFFRVGITTMMRPTASARPAMQIKYGNTIWVTTTFKINPVLNGIF
jgi:hypothetical protein